MEIRIGFDAEIALRIETNRRNRNHEINEISGRDGRCRQVKHAAQKKLHPCDRNAGCSSTLVFHGNDQPAQAVFFAKAAWPGNGLADFAARLTLRIGGQRELGEWHTHGVRVVNVDRRAIRSRRKWESRGALLVDRSGCAESF